MTLCEDCPPVGYPTDKTRCLPCPRRTEPHKPEPTTDTLYYATRPEVKDAEGRQLGKVVEFLSNGLVKIEIEEHAWPAFKQMLASPQSPEALHLSISLILPRTKT